MSELKIKLGVCGSRGFSDTERLFKILDLNAHKIKLIVSGGCKNSADEIAHEWCKLRGCPILIFYPKWYDEQGNFLKGGGFARNRKIVEQSDKILAVWDEKSRGTENTIQIAGQLGKPVKIITFKPSDNQDPVLSEKSAP